jgi:hypothetical protein
MQERQSPLARHECRSEVAADRVDDDASSSALSEREPERRRRSGLVRSERPTLKLDDVRLNRRWRSDRGRARTASALGAAGDALLLIDGGSAYQA